MSDLIFYFAGDSGRPSVEEEIEENNYPKLQSYVNDMKSIRRRIDKGLKTFIDSGAFSAHTKGVEIDVDKYIDWLNYYDDYVTIAAQIDTIPGKYGEAKTKEDVKFAAEESWRNYLYMRERLDNPDKLLPVFHQGEDFKFLKQMFLKQMLDYRPKIDYIGVSPTNDLPVKNKIMWLEYVFDIIRKSGNPNVKTHGFGFTSPQGLKRFNFTSVDSASWIMTAASGSIHSHWGTLLVSEVSKNKPNHVTNRFNTEGLQELCNYIESRGFTLEELATNHVRRFSWNLHYVLEMVENLDMERCKSKQTYLW